MRPSSYHEGSTPWSADPTKHLADLPEIEDPTLEPAFERFEMDPYTIEGLNDLGAEVARLFQKVNEKRTTQAEELPPEVDKLYQGISKEVLLLNDFIREQKERIDTGESDKVQEEEAEKMSRHLQHLYNFVDIYVAGDACQPFLAAEQPPSFGDLFDLTNLEEIGMFERPETERLVELAEKALASRNKLRQYVDTVGYDNIAPEYKNLIENFDAKEDAVKTALEEAGEVVNDRRSVLPENAWYFLEQQCDSLESMADSIVGPDGEVSNKEDAFVLDRVMEAGGDPAPYVGRGDLSWGDLAVSDRPRIQFGDGGDELTSGPRIDRSGPPIFNIDDFSSVPRVPFGAGADAPEPVPAFSLSATAGHSYEATRALWSESKKEHERKQSEYQEAVRDYYQGLKQEQDESSRFGRFTSKLKASLGFKPQLPEELVSMRMEMLDATTVYARFSRDMVEQRSSGQKVYERALDPKIRERYQRLLSRSMILNSLQTQLAEQSAAADALAFEKSQGFFARNRKALGVVGAGVIGAATGGLMLGGIAAVRSVAGGALSATVTRLAHNQFSRSHDETIERDTDSYLNEIRDQLENNELTGDNLNQVYSELVELYHSVDRRKQAEVIALIGLAMMVGGATGIGVGAGMDYFGQGGGIDVGLGDQPKAGDLASDVEEGKKVLDDVVLPDQAREATVFQKIKDYAGTFSSDVKDSVGTISNDVEDSVGAFSNDVKETMSATIKSVFPGDTDGDIHKDIAADPAPRISTDKTVLDAPEKAPVVTEPVSEDTLAKVTSNEGGVDTAESTSQPNGEKSVIGQEKNVPGEPKVPEPVQKKYTLEKSYDVAKGDNLWDIMEDQTDAQALPALDHVAPAEQQHLIKLVELHLNKNDALRAELGFGNSAGELAETSSVNVEKLNEIALQVARENNIYIETPDVPVLPESSLEGAAVEGAVPKASAAEAIKAATSEAIPVQADTAFPATAMVGMSAAPTAAGIGAAVVREFAVKYRGGFNAFERDFKTKFVDTVQGPDPSVSLLGRMFGFSPEKTNAFEYFASFSITDFEALTALDTAARNEYLKTHGITQEDLVKWQVALDGWKKVPELEVKPDARFEDVAKAAFVAGLTSEVKSV